MGEPGFTPAPWIVHPFNARVDCQKISDKGGLLPVCQMLWPTDERTEQETEANARLIAAAPALYEALVEARLSVAADLEEARDPEGRTHDFVALFEHRLAKIDAALSLALGEK